MRHLVAPLLIVFVLFSLVACGGGGKPPSTSEDTPGLKDAKDLFVFDPGPVDPGPSEVVPRGEDVVIPGEDVGTEEVEVSEQCFGTFGCPCKKNQDCLSGYCIDSPNGKVCTDYCYESGDCPEGWDCKQLIGEPNFICVAYGLYLCRPCRENSECSSSLELSENRCVLFGASGNFCGVKCGGEEDRPCPPGYSCQNVHVVGGGTSDQCVPDNGVCECNFLAIQAGAATDCYIANEWGKCKGERRCLASGLSECDARTPAREECNNKDDDCDGETDPEGSVGCVTYYQDIDLDGFGMGVGQCLCKDPGSGYTTTPGDCNDVNNGVHPGAQEICNGFDDDCDGVTDNEGSPGCSDYYLDSDGDGYGVTGQKKCLCKPEPPYTAQKIGDCDDTKDSVFPEAKEKCDGLDNDCDGITDPENALGCQPWYYDGDGDSFGSTTKFKCLCQPTGSYNTTKSGDCDDLDPLVNPLASEVCNGKDDNCNGQTDEGDPSILCPPMGGINLHGKVECQGKCVVTQCDPPSGSGPNYVPGWYDVNGDYKDGCECQAGMEEGLGGAMCTEALDKGTLADNASKITISGNIVPAEDEDWYLVTAQDLFWNAEPNGCDLFNLKVIFTKNPGNAFVVDVYRGTCAEANNLCLGGRVFEWATNFQPSAKGPGECACSTVEKPNCNSPADYDACVLAAGPDNCNSCPGWSEKGKNFCSDNTAKFYIRVRLADKSKPTCENYEIEVSNGAYPWSHE